MDKRRVAHTSTEGEASDANATHATSYDIYAVRDNVRVYSGPVESCPDLDKPRVLMNNDILEPGH
jgi:hypothetical protein